MDYMISKHRHEILRNMGQCFSEQLVIKERGVTGKDTKL